MRGVVKLMCLWEWILWGLRGVHLLMPMCTKSSIAMHSFCYAEASAKKHFKDLRGQAVQVSINVDSVNCDFIGSFPVVKEMAVSLMYIEEHAYFM